MTRRAIALAFAMIATACSPEEPATPKLRPASDSGAVTADDIPVAHTPPGGYGQSFPLPGTPMWRYRLQTLWKLLTQ